MVEKIKYKKIMVILFTLFTLRVTDYFAIRMWLLHVYNCRYPCKSGEWCYIYIFQIVNMYLNIPIEEKMTEFWIRWFRYVQNKGPLEALVRIVHFMFYSPIKRGRGKTRRTCRKLLRGISPNNSVFNQAQWRCAIHITDLT